MADNPEQEPSIEEILASIRQIISDDDGGEPEAAPEPPPPPPPPKRKPEPEPDEDVLELTERLDEPEPERVQIDMQDADDDGDSIFTDSAENAALQGFARLASRAPLDRRGTGDTTIEDIVRELMKPMLREWLDVHLPPLIEKVVQRELRKVAQRVNEE